MNTQPADTLAKMPHEQFAERCLGPEAYDPERAPVLLQHAVVRERALLDKLASRQAA